MIEIVKKHWLVGCIIILKNKVNELEKELTKKDSFQTSKLEKICKNKNRIVVHSKKGESDERGIQLIKYINNLGCIATGIVSVSQNIIFSDLRYFHESDYQEANQVRKLLLNELGLELTLNYIPEYSHKAKEGYFEIWLK